VPELLTSLQSARARGVLVRLILETTQNSAGTLTHDGIAAFEGLGADLEICGWPRQQRPAGPRLHAKTAVADGQVAFVTSANLTGHAMEQNLEVAVLIRGGSAPRRLLDHFRALIAKGSLQRV
jgi:phosphatidylserine/phosphatidylglycerophosphate/cardiolipin synthase-like enzyme